MGTSIVEGTLTAREVGRVRKKFTVFKSLTFERDDGSTETLKKMVARPEVAQWLQPGASGRFYRFSAFDVKGIHGVRLRDGTEIQAYPDPNRPVFLLATPLFLAWIAFMAVAEGRVPMLAVILLVMMAIGLAATRSTKRASLAEFERDGAPRRSAPAPTSPNL